MWEGGRQESDESERERRATECVLVVHTHRIRKIVSLLAQEVWYAIGKSMELTLFMSLRGVVKLV